MYSIPQKPHPYIVYARVSVYVRTGNRAAGQPAGRGRGSGGNTHGIYTVRSMMCVTHVAMVHRTCTRYNYSNTGIHVASWPGSALVRYGDSTGASSDVSFRPSISDYK